MFPTPRMPESPGHIATGASCTEAEARAATTSPAMTPPGRGGRGENII